MKNSQSIQPSQLLPPPQSQSWANGLADYILQRRQQTNMVYNKHHKTHDSHTQTSGDRKGDRQLAESNSFESTLFKALLIVLTQRLEEGHTVFSINVATDADEKNDNVAGRLQGEQMRLYRWQSDVLEMLAIPLYEVIDVNASDAIQDDEASESVANTNIEQLYALLDVLGVNDIAANPVFDTAFDTALDTEPSTGKNDRPRMRMQGDISQQQRLELDSRCHLIVQMYHLLIACNQSDVASTPEGIKNTLINSLGKEKNSKLAPNIKSVINLVTHITANTLLSDINLTEGSLYDINSLSKFNNPIIYQTTINPNNVTLTFWLHRTWQAEYNLARHISYILKQTVQPLKINLPESLNEQQVNAIHVANQHAFSIITGGPGTGKTYTVAQLVMALHHSQKNADLSEDATLALAAPTGKAAQRMQESLQAAIEGANIQMQLPEAKTIHRLLGIGRDGRPRYHADNPLGEDIIIVDEASMLGVELANHLVSSVKAGARLILLGDANQLAAVDAGAVLADLCRIPSLASIHAELLESRRFDSGSGIGKLARLIHQKDADMEAVWQVINSDGALTYLSVNQTDEINSYQNSLSKSNFNITKQLCEHYQNYLSITQKFLSSDIQTHQLNGLFSVFNTFRILTAGHHGKWGDQALNDYLSHWHRSELKLPLGKSPWYHGRPVMILQNNYELGLYNGDIGICLQVSQHNDAGQGRGLEVFFENKEQGIAVNLLNDDLIATAYAMTIHKSQGSEFDHVAITFDDSNTRLLSKELIYTAVTRAKRQVSLFSTKQALAQAIMTPTQRHTGLGLQFARVCLP